MKYCADEFKVTLIWFTDKGVERRSFKKYKDAVAWAEQYLDTDLISVRITGTLSKNLDLGDEKYNENFNNERKL